MPEPGVVNEVYAALTQPIRQRPIASLIFFLALLGIGYMLHGQLRASEVWQQTLLTLFSVVPAAGVVLVLHRLLVMRREPSRLKNPAALEEIKRSFVGRDDDATDLADLVASSYQVWLNGDSGVGKSLLLRKAVVPALEQRHLTPLYLSSWRGDWEEAPANAVLTALGKVTEGSVMDCFAAALAARTDLVVILDQFDEFQVEHVEKFILPTGNVISRAQLEERNRFFCILNSEIQRRRLRCIFVTRRDVEWGKRAVLFDDAHEFYLRRLPQNVVEGEIDRLLPPGTVVNPENGWIELRQRLSRDLGDLDVLPVQLRFTVLGLAELRNSLTVQAYTRVGGLRGLISRYVESEIRKVAGNRTLALELVPLLNRLVAPDGEATAFATEEQLLAGVDESRKLILSRAFEEFERRDIVRRVLHQDGQVLWRLDHDYLAGPVREISRRQTPQQWELAERLDRYKRTSWWKQTFQLAGPVTITRMIWFWSFRGLRFRAASSWILFSIAWSSALFSVLTLGAVSGSQWLLDKQQGRELFGVFSNNDSLNSNSDQEARALLEIAGASRGARQAFLEEALQTESNAIALKAHEFGIALAVSGVSSSEAIAFYRNVIHSKMNQVHSEPTVTLESFRLIKFWNLVPSVGPDAQSVALMLAGHLCDEKQFDSAHNYIFALEVLRDKITPATAQEIVAKLMARLHRDDAPYGTLERLVEVVNFLQDKVALSTIPDLAKLLIDRATVESENSVRYGPWQKAELDELRSMIAAMKDKVDPSTIKTVIALQVAAVKSAVSFTNRYAGRPYSPFDFSDGMSEQLTSGLFALRPYEDKATQQFLADVLLEETLSQARKYAFSLPSRSIEHLYELQQSIKKETTQAVVALLIDKFKRLLTDKYISASSVSEIVTASEPFRSAIPISAYTDLVTAIEQQLNQSDTYQWDLDSIAKALVSLHGMVASSTYQRLATRAVELMNPVKNGEFGMEDLANAVYSLRNEIKPLTAQRLATTLVNRMKNQTDTASLRPLAKALSALPDLALGPAELTAVRAAFRIPDAPCSLALVFESDIRHKQIVEQLQNPLCAQPDWRRLALRAAQESGRHFAAEDKNGEIRINFTELSDYLSSQDPARNRHKFGAAEVSAASLLLFALVVFIVATVRWRGDRHH